MRKKQSAGKAGNFFGKDGPTGRGWDYEIKGRRLIARQYRNPDRVVIAFEPFCMQQFHQGHSKICCADYHIDVEPWSLLGMQLRRPNILNGPRGFERQA